MMALLAYLLMLLVMTYNYPILIVISVGLAIGHFSFDLIGLPTLPSSYKQIAGSGAYMPEPDNCCCKV